MAKLKIKSDSPACLDALLQETYDNASRLENLAQESINALQESTNLSNESVENKAKYSKAIHDFMTDKMSANKQKIEISKIMKDNIKISLAVPENTNETLDDLNVLLSSLKNEEQDKTTYNVSKIK